MKICHICNEYPFETHGGVGMWVQNISRRLVKLGHQVTVIGFYPSEGVVDDEGVRVIKIKPGNRHKLSPLIDRHRLHARLKQMARMCEIDLIELYEGNAFLIPTVVEVPVVLRLRVGHHVYGEALGGMRREFWKSLFEKRYIPRADFLAAVSSYIADANRRLLRLGNRNITIIPNYVDFHNFALTDASRVKTGLVLYCGSLNWVKGALELIAAVPEILEHVPSAHFAFVGRDTRDRKTGASFTRGLQEKIPESVTDRVNFAGWVPHSEVASYIQKAAVCVYPSKMEGCPNAWPEAMACGKAVVASRTGPGPEIIEDGVSGLLCDPWDPKDIADKVIRVLKDPKLAERLGRNARRRVEEHFSPEVLVPKNIQFYKECIERFKRGETDRQRTFWRR